MGEQVEGDGGGGGSGRGGRGEGGGKVERVEGGWKGEKGRVEKP